MWATSTGLTANTRLNNAIIVTYSYLVLEDWINSCADEVPGWGETVVRVRSEPVHYTRRGAHDGAPVSICARYDSAVLLEKAVVDGNVVDAEQAVVDQRVGVGHHVCGCGWRCPGLFRVGVNNFHSDRPDLVLHCPDKNQGNHPTLDRSVRLQSALLSQET